MRVRIELVLCPDINQCRAFRRADEADQLLDGNRVRRRHNASLL